MESKPTPPNFKTIEEVVQTESRDQNVIGVVTDLLPPKQSKGTDWTGTFSIADSSVFGLGQKVRFFAKRENDLPPIQKPGDVIILHKIRNRPWSGMPVLVSNVNTEWVIIHAAEFEHPKGAKLKHIKSPRAPVPTPDQIGYATSLTQSQDQSVFVQPAVGRPSSEPREKFALIKNIGISQYRDIVGQVVKLWHDHERLQLYITDYTSNELLFEYKEKSAEQEEARDGDEYGYQPNNSTSTDWPGPYGKLTLNVTLFPPHSYWANQHIKVDDFVFLQNVHIKLGRREDSRLEGVIHEDKRERERIHVSRADPRNDDRAKDVLRRKKEYQEQNGLLGGKNPQAQKRKGDTNTDEQKLTKGQRKKLKNKERKAAAKAANEDENSTEETLAPNPNLQTILAARDKLNENITCTQRDQPLISLSALKDTSTSHAYKTPNGNQCTLPFQNFCYKTSVRVIDFFPETLEDFCVKRRVNEFDALSDYSSTSSDHDSIPSSPDRSLPSSPTSSAPMVIDMEEDDDDTGRKYKYEWRFALLVEDSTRTEKEKEKEIFWVAAEDGEYLLNINACNLKKKKNGNVVRELREKLFVLWGDTEELKGEGRLEGAFGSSSDREHGEGDGDGDGVKGEDGNEEGAGKRKKEKIKSCARPFACLVKEYGVKKDGEWERKFRIFGTNIS